MSDVFVFHEAVTFKPSSFILRNTLCKMISNIYPPGAFITGDNWNRLIIKPSGMLVSLSLPVSAGMV